MSAYKSQVSFLPPVAPLSLSSSTISKTRQTKRSLLSSSSTRRPPPSPPTTTTTYQHKATNNVDRDQETRDLLFTRPTLETEPLSDKSQQTSERPTHSTPFEKTSRPSPSMELTPFERPSPFRNKTMPPSPQTCSSSLPITTTTTQLEATPQASRRLSVREKSPSTSSYKMEWSPAPAKWSSTTEWSPAPLFRSASTISVNSLRRASPSTSGINASSGINAYSSNRATSDYLKAPTSSGSFSFENRAKGKGRFIIDPREAGFQDPLKWICSLMIFSYDETFVATGFLVKGLRTIFTTAHSLSGAEMVEMKFPGRPLISLALFNLKKDQCIWTDPTHDFAAIRLPNGCATSFAENDGVPVTLDARLRAGDDMWVFGYPFPISREETLDKMRKEQRQQQRLAPGSNGTCSLSDWMMSLPKPSEYIHATKNGNRKDANKRNDNFDDNHNLIPRSPRDISRIQTRLQHDPPFGAVSEDSLKLRRNNLGGTISINASQNMPSFLRSQQQQNSDQPLPGEKIANLYETNGKTTSDWPMIIGGRGRVKSNDGKTIKHLAETEGGDSGGPLLSRDYNGVWRVVAIHLSCRKDGAYNTAALIQKGIVDKIDFLQSLATSSASMNGKCGSGKLFHGMTVRMGGDSSIVAFQKPPSDFLLD